MTRPTVHVISTTRAEAQSVLRSTLPLARRRNTRIIIRISHNSGLKEKRPGWMPSFQWCLQ